MARQAAASQLQRRLVEPPPGCWRLTALLSLLSLLLKSVATSNDKVQFSKLEDCSRMK